jgi:hypothetical protein
MMTVVIKRPVPAFLTKRWSTKKGILVASTFDTHFKWKIFDIFNSSLRLALTFDIHTRTRRVPLGLSADLADALSCSFVFAWPQARQQRAYAGLACPNPRKARYACGPCME